MARPREYDEDVVLEQAMEAFWTHGYEATSMADLMAATGLAKGSVYKGFGDKRALFLRTLERYLARGRAAFAEVADIEGDALEVLHAWLVHALDASLRGGVRRGCFKVNCSVELGPHDEEIRKRLQSHERSLQSMYRSTIERGIREGSLRPDLEPKAAARFVDTVIAGIGVATKTGMSRKEALAMAELALDALRRR